MKDVKAVPDDAAALDAADPLSHKRDAFELPEGLVYLDGNSLGALPRGVPARLERMVRAEWGRDLIRSWNEHGWIDLPSRVGDKIARIVGATPGEVIASDSTTVNLFKVLSAALRLAPDRSVILSTRDNFPTDLYVAEQLVESTEGRRLRLVEAHEIERAIDAQTAIVMLTGVDYRSGALLDMEALTRRAHAEGALVVWDLSHSAGVLPLALDAHGVDFAVGCGYKYLNGGPGAPAFVFVARRHQERALPLLAGWMGHRAPFAFETSFSPSEDIRRFAVGTPPLLSMVALDEALDVFDDVDMREVREKSMRLSDLFIARMAPLEAEHGLRLLSPRDAKLRGSQVAYAHPDGYAMIQAAIEAGVIGDYRAPDVLRFGFAPLYLRYADVEEAARRIGAVLRAGRWREPRWQQRAKVT
jgi:kynureninase